MTTTIKTTLWAMLMLLFAGSLLTSCNESEDKEDDPNSPDTVLHNGLYVLCEGLYGRNNSSIDFYSIESRQTTTDLFLQVNFAGLGETANDMIEAEGKLFIAVCGSNCVMVADKATCRRLALIPISQSDNPQPRCLAYSNGYVYLSCFDGNIHKINASTYKIEKTAKSFGRNPEAIAICQGKLFVANTGGLDYPNFDNSISVLDPDDLSLISKVEGFLNPGRIEVCGSSIIFQKRGTYDYATSSYKDSELIRLNATTLEVEQRANVIVNDFTLCGDKLIYTYTDNNLKPYIMYLPLDNLADTPQQFISPESEDISGLMTPYHICSDGNHIYLTDAKDYTNNGECRVYDHSGKLQYKFSTWINPTKVIAVQ